jgi:methyl coenzyme M reductase subunit D
VTKHSNIAKITLLGLGALVVCCIAYALVVSKGRTIFPIRIKVEHSHITVPEGGVWVSALEQQLTPEQFDEVVRTNHQGRDFALGLFAYNNMTNHVRVLVKYGAETSDEAIEALRLSGMSNVASLIQSVVNDMKQSSSNNGAEVAR